MAEVPSTSRMPTSARTTRIGAIHQTLFSRRKPTSSRTRPVCCECAAAARNESPRIQVSGSLMASRLRCKQLILPRLAWRLLEGLAAATSHVTSRDSQALIPSDILRSDRDQLGEGCLPRISEFRGVAIDMYYLDHGPPHAMRSR